MKGVPWSTMYTTPCEYRWTIAPCAANKESHQQLYLGHTTGNRTFPVCHNTASGKGKTIKEISLLSLPVSLPVVISLHCRFLAQK
jgi:hypothetical protein